MHMRPEPHRYVIEPDPYALRPSFGERLAALANSHPGATLLIVIGLPILIGALIGP